MVRQHGIGALAHLAATVMLIQRGVPGRVGVGGAVCGVSAAIASSGAVRAGFDNNVEVALRYTAAWLDGLGCVPIHHLMEDAATAEIARAQLWQWLHHPGHGTSATTPVGGLEFPDHAPIDFALFDQALAAHTHRLRASTHPGAARADEASALLSALTHAEQLGDFLTLPAYDRLA